MNVFDDYDKLLLYAISCIKNRKHLVLTEHDLVNEAFVYFSDKEYTFQKAKTYIGEIAGNDVSNLSSPLSAIGKKNFVLEHEKFCKKCKDSKPLTSFYYNYHAQKHVWFHSILCKECSLERDRKNFLKRRTSNGVPIREYKQSIVFEDGTKECRTCNEVKQPSEFREGKSSCRKCTNFIQNERKKMKQQQSDPFVVSDPSPRFAT